MSSSATPSAAAPAGPMPLYGPRDIAFQTRAHQCGAAACPDHGQSIAVDDWDLMFDAVRTRLMRTVGERLGELPDVPQHSAELSASLVQAVVLDCVRALDRLHAALEQERSQRPTS